MLGITNYVDFVRQTVSGRSSVKPERKDTSDPSAVVFNIPALKMREDIDLSTSTSGDGAVPSRWTSGDLYTNDINSPMGYRVNKEALDRVREQLKSEGIDADGRTPTHEITDEQMDWLEERYDFNYLSVCGYTHTEFGNFMLDLAYLNVFSLDEVEDMCGVMPLDTDVPRAVSVYYHGDPETGEGAGFISLTDGEIIKEEELYNENIASYLKAKYKDRTEAEYKEMTEKLAVQMNERMKLLNAVFECFAENMGYAENDIFPNIEDASEKLKEDFGGLM